MSLNAVLNTKYKHNETKKHQIFPIRLEKKKGVGLGGSGGVAHELWGVLNMGLGG